MSYNNDSDRYVWLLANMGLVENRAKHWNPSKDIPLLNYLQVFIDQGIQKEKGDWIERQRKLLQRRYT